MPPLPPVGAPMADQSSELFSALTGAGQAIDPDTGNPIQEPDRVSRETPQPEEPRRRLVQRWIARVKADKRRWEKDFKRMRNNMRFVYGEQWPGDVGEIVLPDWQKKATPYTANIALRHVQQRTASLYATNPTVMCRRRRRMLATVWDGDMVTLAAAQQQMQQAALMQAQQAQMTGVPVNPTAIPPGGAEAAAVIADARNVQQYNKMLDRVGKTLELLWDYNVSEQTFPFKVMMKMTVRRAIVCGASYVKLGFQRVTQVQPEIETRIADMVARLSTIQRLADDIHDDQLRTEDAEAEQLRLSIQALQQEPQIIMREGLLFDYPDSTAIIPDRKCKSLRGFLGCDWVTQEYILTPEEIQEIYGVDVGKSFRPYVVDTLTGAVTEDRESTSSSHGHDEGRDREGKQGRGCVWEIYSRKDGLVYTVCEGYPEFLREPAVPDVYLDRFWPWFPMVMNEGYSEEQIYPPSDIDLITDMQLELNRARQALREHRHANRPKVAAAGGVLTDNDREVLRNHPANAILELNALQPGQKVEDVLMPVKMPPIDPALYDTNPTFEDLLRVLGTDQAANGQTTSASATETAVAQASQHTDLASQLDDQDDLLSELAEAAGKVLMLNTSAETVQKVIGPGAIWPVLTKEQIVENIYLTIRAGSTGRPNRQQDVQNAQIIFPLLQRVPGISPEWMARELLRRLDDRLDVEDAIVSGMPSMDTMNRIQGTVAVPAQDPTNPITSGQMPVPPTQGAPPGVGVAPMMAGPAPGGMPGHVPPMGGAPNDPHMQGPQGFQNAPAVNPVNGMLGARTPPVPGANGLMPGRGGGPRLTPQGDLPTP